MKKVFAIVAAGVLAIVPCAWDGNSLVEASWLSAVLAAYAARPQPASVLKDEGGARFRCSGDPASGDAPACLHPAP